MMASAIEAKSVTSSKGPIFELPTISKAVWVRHNIHVPLNRQLCRYLDISEDKTAFRVYLVQGGLYLELCDKRGSSK